MYWGPVFCSQPKKGQNFKTFAFQDIIFKFTQHVDFEALISYLSKKFWFGVRFWAPVPKEFKILNFLFFQGRAFKFTQYVDF